MRIHCCFSHSESGSIPVLVNFLLILLIILLDVNNDLSYKLLDISRLVVGFLVFTCLSPTHLNAKVKCWILSLVESLSGDDIFSGVIDSRNFYYISLIGYVKYAENYRYKFYHLDIIPVESFWSFFYILRPNSGTIPSLTKVYI